MKAGAVAAVHSTSEEDREGGGASNTENINEEPGMFVEEEGNELEDMSFNKRMSAESQDFEFNKLGGLTSSASSQSQCVEAGVQKLASADELFYKGQLLPLQYCSPRAPSYVRSLTSSPITQLHDLLSVSSPPRKSSELPLSNSLIRDQDMRFSSCRMDHVPGALDHSCLFELTRSSSFRSHSIDYSSYYCNYYANYHPPCSNGSRWDSFSTPSCTTTSGGECSSSSRDSNGSSQDSCMSCPDTNTREQHAVCSCHGLHAPAGVHGPFNTKRKPGFMQSWKILFNGLRRGTQSAGVLGNHQGRHNPSVHGSLSRASATAANREPGPSAAPCLCKVPREKVCMVNDQVLRSPSRNTASLMWEQGKDQNGKVKASQVISSADHKIIVPVSRKKEEDDHRESKVASTASKGSRWQGYTRRIKPISMIKATWPTNHAKQMIGDRRHGASTAGNDSRDYQQDAAGDPGRLHHIKERGTPQATPLERKFSQPSLVSTVLSGVKEHSKVQVLFKFHTVSRSCPVSVKSSPNHSGLLVPTSPPNLITHNMGAMQELHSAVQSAIAHCKQSVAATPSSTA